MFPSLPNPAQAISNAVGQATQQAAGNIHEAASAAATQAAQAVQAVQGATSAAVDTVERGASGLVEASSVVDRAVRQTAADAEAMIEATAREALEELGTSPEEIDRMISCIVPNLAAALSSFPEFQLIEDLNRTIESVVGSIPPEFIADNSSPEHDGEVTVFMPDGSERDPDSIGDDEEVIYYTNGMMTPPDVAEEQAAELSRKTGKPVVLVYSARQGLVQDIAKGAADKLDPFGLLHPTPATDADAELMYQAAKNGEERHFVAHSRGTIITRNALVRTHSKLYSEYFAAEMESHGNPIQAHINAKRKADDDISNIHVVSAAGAAWMWPPYANVEHISNARDPVTYLGRPAPIADPREFAYEVFGVDMPFLPGHDHLDVTTTENDEKLVVHNWPGYVDDIVDSVD